MKKLMENLSDGAVKLFKIMAFISTIILYNPSGYSYYHFVKSYAWQAAPASFGLAAIGATLFSLSVFMVVESWKMLEVMGKILAFAIIGCIAGAFITSSFFNSHNANHWVSLILGCQLMFIIAGVSYPRIKWALFRTRQVDDSDTPAEESH